MSFRLSLLVVQSYDDGHVLGFSHFPKLPTFLVFPAWKVLPLGQPQPEQPGLASLWLCIRSRASDPRAGTETCDMRKGPQSGLFRFIKSLQFEDEPRRPPQVFSCLSHLSATLLLCVLRAQYRGSVLIVTYLDRLLKTTLSRILTRNLLSFNWIEINMCLCLVLTGKMISFRPVSLHFGRPA